MLKLNICSTNNDSELQKLALSKTDGLEPKPGVWHSDVSLSLSLSLSHILIPIAEL